MNRSWAQSLKSMKVPVKTERINDRLTNRLRDRLTHRLTKGLTDRLTEG